MANALPRLTFFDRAELNYASFFLAGLHQLAAEGRIELQVTHRRPEILLSVDSSERLAHTLFSLLLFHYEDAQSRFYFCIDTRDSNSTGGSGKGYHLPLLKQVQYYFKVNYLPQAIYTDDQIAPYASKIIPMTPFFPSHLPKLLPYLPRLGWQDGNTLRKIILRLRQLKALARLDDLRTFRNLPKVRDVFFVMDWYRPHPEVNEFRYEIAEELRARRAIRSALGFVGRGLPEKYRPYEIRHKLSLKHYLTQLASAKIAIYVRGVHNCHSFKFGQLLAMGLPIVGQRILNDRDRLMRHPFFDVQFAYEEPKAIVDRIEQLLGRPNELAHLGDSNAALYDRHFTPEAVVSDLLTHLRSDTRLIRTEAQA